MGQRRLSQPLTNWRTSNATSFAQFSDTLAAVVATPTTRVSCNMILKASLSLPLFLSVCLDLER
jgi:hypothetical protein